MGKLDKIKYLYVNGDSWSRGDDLPQDQTLPDYPGGPMGRPIGRYSDVLGKKFGWEVWILESLDWKLLKIGTRNMEFILNN